MRYSIALLMVLLIGCNTTTSGSDSVSDSADDEVLQEQAEPVAASTQAEPSSDSAGGEDEQIEAQTEGAEPLSIEDNIVVGAADGLDIVGTFYAGSGEGPWPGIVLLHMLGSERQAWREFGPQLAEAGYAVIAIDMRGHGDTGGGNDWVKAEDDILRVAQYLGNRPDVDATRIAFVGGSIGGNMALRSAALETEVDTVVILSAGTDYQGVTTEDAIVTYGERPIFIAASEGDSFAANSARTLNELAAGETQLQIFDGSAHGTNMLGQESGLEDMIFDWLHQHLS